MPRNKSVYILISLIFISIVFLWQQARAAMVIGEEPIDPNNSDAIAVRIVPNPNHYSIARWYESQGFQGSPQSLLVDGYEAIRDGRTVYVNAANIDEDSKTIYTNIYLISYNQESGPKTVDILGQIVSHWKFNSNLTETSSPTCSISSVSCESDGDCPVSSACAQSGPSSGSCVLKTTLNCAVDADCPNNFFCDSLKSKIIRDLKRIGKLGEIKEALFNFKKSTGYYPKLESGTYLAGNSLSVWPSWGQYFLSALALSQNSVDNINRLGFCPGYDRQTCWNVDTQRFFNNQSATSSFLILPANSYAFAYSTDKNGSSYNLCAVLESRSTSTTSSYHFSSDDPADSDCALAGIAANGQSTNTPPYLVDQLLIGDAGQVFSGYIKVLDPEGNPLSWTLDTSATNWSGWSAAPVLQGTSNPNQKKIYALQAGNPGDYNLNLKVSDGQGGILATTTAIKILSSKILIESDDVEYIIDPVNRLSYSFFFSGNDVASSSFTVTKTSGSFDILAKLKELVRTTTLVGLHKYRVDYSGLVPTDYQFFKDATFKYNIKVTDQKGHSENKNFSLLVKSENPSLDFSCDNLGRVGILYDCKLGPLKQNNHTLNYTGSGFPAGITLTGYGYDKGLQGKATSPTSTTVYIKATNEYGASSTKSFALKINNYCGDGVKQSPNTEGRGGLYNDGYEDCDVTAGVATSVSTSSALQYACQTTSTSSRPFPILTNDQCIFKSPTQGGGYCGDTYCQTIYENKTNCSQDCGAGIILKGVLKNAATQATLSGAIIRITKANGAEVATVNTGANGGYIVNLLPSIEIYTLTASLPGFQDFAQTFVADDDKTIDLSLNALAPISVVGLVTDYMTGNAVSGASIKILKKTDNVEVVNGATNAAGHYSLNLTPNSDQYIIIVSLQGYVDGSSEFLADENKTIDFNLSSLGLGGAARVSLEWNANAAAPDLDAYLFFNPVLIFYFHKCDVLVGKCSQDSYVSCRSDAECVFGRCSDSNRPCYSYGGMECDVGDSCIDIQSGTCQTNIYSSCDPSSTATLDRDDQNNGGSGDTNGSTVGLENIRVVSFLAGKTYKYYVNDFSHQSDPANCKFSAASVKVFNGGGVMVKEYAGSSQPGKCYWHVFDMDSTGRITDVNSYSNSAPQ